MTLSHDDMQHHKHCPGIIIIIIIIIIVIIIIYEALPVLRSWLRHWSIFCRKSGASMRRACTTKEDFYEQLVRDRHHRH